MATNARGQTTLAGAPVTRASIEGLLMQANDIRPVANATVRAQMVSDLTAAGLPPTAARPLYVHRTDAPITHRLEVFDGSGWRPVASACGPGSGTANVFGQVALPHGLGYKPTYYSAVLASGLASGDGSVTESAARDYAVVVWDATPTDIIVRLVNRSTGQWGGEGSRFGFMWEAR